MKQCPDCLEPLPKCRCRDYYDQMRKFVEAGMISASEMQKAISELGKAMAVANGGIFSQSGTSSNANFQFNAPAPNKRPQRSSHERVIEQLVEGAIAEGLNETEVRDIVRKAYSQAAMDDLSTKWVEQTVRGELQALIRTGVYHVGYDDAEDVAIMSPSEFFSRVSPPEQFRSWNDAASYAAKDFERMLVEVDRIRNLGYSPIIIIHERKIPGSGIVANELGSATAVYSALAGVDVRFQVKSDQKYRMAEMLKVDLEKRQIRDLEEKILGQFGNQRRRH